MAVYDLDTDIDRERYRRRTEALLTKRAVVELSEHKPKRSLSQNNYLHLLLGEFAMQTGNKIEYVKREYFKRECNAELFVRSEVDKLTKKEVAVLRSSRDLDTGEMTTAIERFRNWAAEIAGIDLPDAEDRAWLDFISREMQHQKVWL